MERIPFHPCWEWAGGRTPKGYGHFSALDGRSPWRAHRYAFTQAFGQIPEGMRVCHRCDNPGCVRPSHLFLGTDLENNRDKVLKGRQGCGEGVRTAKLTVEAVREIRRRFDEGRAKYADIVRDFGISLARVYHIKSRRGWKHVQ